MAIGKLISGPQVGVSMSYNPGLGTFGSYVFLGGLRAELKRFDGRIEWTSEREVVLTNRSLSDNMVAVDRRKWPNNGKFLYYGEFLLVGKYFAWVDSSRVSVGLGDGLGDGTYLIRRGWTLELVSKRKKHEKLRGGRAPYEEESQPCYWSDFLEWRSDHLSGMEEAGVLMELDRQWGDRGTHAMAADFFRERGEYFPLGPDGFADPVQLFYLLQRLNST